MNLLTINIIEVDNDKAIEVLHNGYNIVQKTIYDNDLANKILKLINENIQSNLNDAL